MKQMQGISRRHINSYFFFELFSFAVFPELVKIAVSSFDSLCNILVRSLFKVSDSIISSNQKGGFISFFFHYCDF